MNQDTTDLLTRWPLALQLDLQPGEKVIVVGAYKGLTIDLLDTLYPDLRFIGYEPQGWAWEEAVRRLSQRLGSRLTLYPYAIGAEAGERMMWEHDTDAASFYRTDQRLVGTVNVRDVHEEMWKWELTHDRSDMLLMNCEGAEFELLPILIEQGVVKCMRQLVLQFHMGLGNDDGYIDICKSLLKTHRCLRADKDWHWWVKR